MDDLRDQTAVVTGGSRGFGRGIVEALAGAGMRVVAVARDPGALAREVKGRVETVAADATDPVTAARVIDRERPRVLVLNAGATGPHRPTRLQTWETFIRGSAASPVRRLYALFRVTSWIVGGIHVHDLPWADAAQLKNCLPSHPCEVRHLWRH